MRFWTMVLIKSEEAGQRPWKASLKAELLSVVLDGALLASAHPSLHSPYGNWKPHNPDEHLVARGGFPVTCTAC